MTPPEAQGSGTDAAPGTPPAVSFCVLQKRADFLRAASAKRQATAGFLLQARARGDDQATIRVGYTCSKKIGNAVMRNRAKRRLRAIARSVLPRLAQPGWDYVLVGRPGATVTKLFSDLERDLRSALQTIHRVKS